MHKPNILRRWSRLYILLNYDIAVVTSGSGRDETETIVFSWGASIISGFIVKA